MKKILLIAVALATMQSVKAQDFEAIQGSLEEIEFQLQRQNDQAENDCWAYKDSLLRIYNELEQEGRHSEAHMVWLRIIGTICE